MKNQKPSATTLADLVITARLAAQKAFALKEPLAIARTKLEEFTASGFDALDFPTWEQSFLAELEMLGVFSQQDSLATAAAKRAAAAKVD